MSAFRWQKTLVGELYMFGDVVENVGLKWHFHVDGAGNPDQLALSNVEYAIDFVYFVSANLLVPS
jgi:hypothetical protein